MRSVVAFLAIMLLCCFSECLSETNIVTVMHHCNETASLSDYKNPAIHMKESYANNHMLSYRAGPIELNDTYF